MIPKVLPIRVQLFFLCDEKNVKELEGQVKALLHFKQHGFYTAYPIALKDSTSYVYTDEKIKAIMYDFLSGSPKPFAHVTPKVMHGMGLALGQLHKVPLLPDLPEFPMGLPAMEPFLVDVQTTAFNEHPFTLFLRKQVRRLKEVANDDTLPQGILHGDIFPDNCLYDGENLVAIIDWEEVCHGPLLLDVGMTICGCCYPTNNKLDSSLVDSLLEAYNSVRPMSEKEKKLLPEFVDYANLACAFWRFRQFNIRAPDPSLADKYKEMFDRVLHE